MPKKNCETCSAFIAGRRRATRSDIAQDPNTHHFVEHTAEKMTETLIETVNNAATTIDPVGSKSKHLAAMILREIGSNLS